MMEQQRLPFPTAAPNHWQRGGFLSPAILNPLHDINCSWLEILASPLFRDLSDTGSCMGRGSLEPLRPADRIAARVAQLDPQLRPVMARCPFALFGARFHDSGYWARIGGLYSIHEPASELIATRPIAAARRAILISFAQLAFFYAWHLVHLNPLAARLLLGVGDEVSVILKELPLPHLQQLAAKYPETITPRWSERPLFWQVLLNATQKGETHLTETRLLGIQMVAADLLPSSGHAKERNK